MGRHVTQRLSARGIEAIKKAKKPRRKRDGDGLVLQTDPNTGNQS